MCTSQKRRTSDPDVRLIRAIYRSAVLVRDISIIPNRRCRPHNDEAKLRGPPSKTFDSCENRQGGCRQLRRLVSLLLRTAVNERMPLTGLPPFSKGLRGFDRDHEVWTHRKGVFDQLRFV